MSLILSVKHFTIHKRKLSPKLKFGICADSRAKGIDIAFRPDGAMRELTRDGPANHSYWTRGMKQNLVIDDPSPRRPRKGKKKKGKGSEEEGGYFDWCLDGLVIEFKKSHSQDPFYSSEELGRAAKRRDEKVKASDDGTKVDPLSFERDSDEARRIRGQLAAYATESFVHQHRTHLFQLLIFGHYARFLFWDHSGAIVSDRFDYVADSKLLVKFIWIYNHMSEPERGWDPTATFASPEEEAVFNTAVTQFLTNMNDPSHEQRVIPHVEDTMYQRYPVYKVAVPNVDKTERPTEVLVKRPFFSSPSVLGRGTRGYLAYALKAKKLLFMKDTWRVVHERLIAEGTTLANFNDLQIEHVPQLECGGDVVGELQETRVLEWAMKQKLQIVYSKLRVFQHHRLLMPLAYPVEHSRNSEEFVMAFLDCCHGMSYSTLY